MRTKSDSHDLRVCRRRSDPVRTVQPWTNPRLEDAMSVRGSSSADGTGLNAGTRRTVPASTIRSRNPL